jgi:hypothetical protein
MGLRQIGAGDTQRISGVKNVSFTTPQAACSLHPQVFPHSRTVCGIILQFQYVPNAPNPNLLSRVNGAQHQFAINHDACPPK